MEVTPRTDGVELEMSDVKTVKQLYEQLQRIIPPVEPAEQINDICDILYHNRIIIMLSEIDTEDVPADSSIGTKIFYVKDEIIGNLFPGMTLLRVASFKDEEWSARVEIDVTAAFDVVVTNVLKVERWGDDKTTIRMRHHAPLIPGVSFYLWDPSFQEGIDIFAFQPSNERPREETHFIDILRLPHEHDPEQ